MWLYLCPCHVNKKADLVVAMVDRNWNTWDEPVAVEIMHDILANLDGGLTTDHQPRAGHDISVWPTLQR